MSYAMCQLLTDLCEINRTQKKIVTEKEKPQLMKIKITILQLPIMLNFLVL